MDHIVIDGVLPYDGRYEFDLADRSFTTFEWGWIKKYSGYLPTTFMDGWRGADAELLAVFAIIALTRAGKISRDQIPQAWERFGDAPGVITVQLEFDTEDEEEDAHPPPSEPSSNANGSSSGPGSTTSSEPSETTQPATGTPALATSESLPVT